MLPQIHSVKALGLLHENLALLPGIQQAVEDRAHALLTLQTLISDIEKKKDKVPATHCPRSSVQMEL